MAISLQGELGAFGIDDVLALVATKVGVLEVRDAGRVARVHLDSGEVVAADDGASTDVLDVLAGLLRWQAGAFSFLDGERPPAETHARPIAEALAAARALLQEWLDVETVIPSTRARLSLAAEAPSVDVRLAPSEWVAVAAIGSGAAAADAATAVGRSLLFGMQVLKGLAERGLVEVGAAQESAPAPAPVARSAEVDLRRPAPAVEVQPEPEPALVDAAEPAPASPESAPTVAAEPAVELPTLAAAVEARDTEERRRMLGAGNGPLSGASVSSDDRRLPDLHSIESFAQPSSSVESLARVLDAVNEQPGGADAEPGTDDDDRVALLKELEALRDGIRSAPAPPRPAEPPAKVTAERKGRRN